MTEKQKRTSRTKKRTKLPRSGLAEEILGKAAPTWEPGDQTAEAVAPSIGIPEVAAEPPTGPDRIYDFADSLDLEDQADAQEKVEKLETWVTFELAGEIYALPVTHVQEILRVNSITSVPHAPNPIRGVTNKRGRVLPVVDLRVRLAMPRTDLGPRSRILVVESKKRLLGLLVDAVQQVVRIVPSRVQPPPADIMTEQSDFILGVYNLDETLMIQLDVDRILVIHGTQQQQAPSRQEGTEA